MRHNPIKHKWVEEYPYSCQPRHQMDVSGPLYAPIALQLEEVLGIVIRLEAGGTWGMSEQVAKRNFPASVGMEPQTPGALRSH
jgi:hypothetical protein